MKNTGIVRRLDDFGRIIIPKEIRRNFKINAGGPLEISILKDGILLTKYDSTPDKEKIAQTWLQEMKTKMADQYVRFSIDGDITICEGVRDNKRVTGVANHNPSDPFSPTISMIYAYCKAFGADNPLEKI